MDSLVYKEVRTILLLHIRAAMSCDYQVIYEIESGEPNRPFR